MLTSVGHHNSLYQVICRLLSLPEDYWRRVLAVQTDLVSTSSSTVKTYSQEDGQGRVTHVLTVSVKQLDHLCSQMFLLFQVACFSL